MSTATYLDWANPAVKTLQKRFPKVRLRTIAELKAWLRESVPPTILSQMVFVKAIRVCSGISPFWAELSLRKGFATHIVSIPGHFYNVVLCKEGPVKVDLSGIQFDFDVSDYSGSEKERVLDMVTRNPFKAVKVEKLEGGLPIGYAPKPVKFDKFYNPISSYFSAIKTMRRILTDRDEYKKFLEKRMLSRGGAEKFMQDYDDSALETLAMTPNRIKYKGAVYVKAAAPKKVAAENLKAGQFIYNDEWHDVRKVEIKGDSVKLTLVPLRGISKVYMTAQIGTLFPCVDDVSQVPVRYANLKTAGQKVNKETFPRLRKRVEGIFDGLQDALDKAADDVAKSVRALRILEKELMGLELPEYVNRSDVQSVIARMREVQSIPQEIGSMWDTKELQYKKENLYSLITILVSDVAHEGKPVE